MNRTYFQWDSSLITGIEDIDKQHQGLIEVINDALQLCFSNDLIDRQSIEEIYTKLTEYVAKHFKDEEDL